MSRSIFNLLKHAAVLAVGLGLPGLAQAADLPIALPPEPVIAPPVVIGAAWYLRGDVGVGATYVDDMHLHYPKEKLAPGYTVDKVGVSDQFFAGAGVGVQVTPFLRGDITAQYRGGGNLHAEDSFGPGIAVGRYNGHLSTVVVMANGYFDLGTWYGVTPFIGAGVGSAFHQVHGFYETPVTGGRGPGSAKDNWSNSLAWALHAGVAFNVTPNFLVEVGYSYSHLGTAKSGGVVCTYNPSCEPASYSFKDIQSHDVRLGVRYLLGGVAAPLPPVYEPGPVVSKY